MDTRTRRLGGVLSAAALVLVGVVPAYAAAPPPSCFGMAATIVGTPGDDVLVGREDTADVIVGLGGNDRIDGSEDLQGQTAPGDRLCGGDGNDRIRGGVGEDRIDGGSGNDDVDGGFGYDVVTQGGPGNDRVSDCDSEYTSGTRLLRGGPGDDVLCVDVDSTVMLGEGGDDVLLDFDCLSVSVLNGGPGNDRIESYFQNFDGRPCSEFGFSDADLVIGGTGLDTGIVNDGDRLVGVEIVEVR